MVPNRRAEPLLSSSIRIDSLPFSDLVSLTATTVAGTWLLFIIISLANKGNRQNAIIKTTVENWIRVQLIIVGRKGKDELGYVQEGLC